MNKIECCHGCTKRAVWVEDGKIKDCHGTCGDYIKESNALKERNEMIHNIKCSENVVSSYINNEKRKNIKNARKGKK